MKTVLRAGQMQSAYGAVEAVTDGARTFVLAV